MVLHFVNSVTNIGGVEYDEEREERYRSLRGPPRSRAAVAGDAAMGQLYIVSSHSYKSRLKSRKAIFPSPNLSRARALGLSQRIVYRSLFV